MSYSAIPSRPTDRVSDRYAIFCEDAPTRRESIRLFLERADHRISTDRFMPGPGDTVWGATVFEAGEYEADSAFYNRETEFVLDRVRHVGSVMLVNAALPRVGVTWAGEVTRVSYDDIEERGEIVFRVSDVMLDHTAFNR